MRLSTNELIVIAIVIMYIAFFSNPPPSHIQNFLESPIGHIVLLLGLLYVTVYQSLIVGIFLGIAYIMTARKVTEYLDEKEQTPEKKEPKMSSEGVPEPAFPNALQSLLNKPAHVTKPVIHDMLNGGKNKLNKTGDTVKHSEGDTRLPQENGKNADRLPSSGKTPTADERKESFTERFSPF